MSHLAVSSPDVVLYFVHEILRVTWRDADSGTLVISSSLMKPQGILLVTLENWCDIHFHLDLQEARNYAPKQQTLPSSRYSIDSALSRIEDELIATWKKTGYGRLVIRSHRRKDQRFCIRFGETTSYQMIVDARTLLDCG